MFELNIKGVISRYGDDAPQQFRELHYSYKPEVASDFQVLKSLDCWLYQCAEGVVMYDPFYTFFAEDVARFVMRKIINRLSGYERAEWG